MTGYRSQPFDPDHHDTVTFDTQRLIQKIINVAAALTTCPGITASPQTPRAPHTYCTVPCLARDLVSPPRQA